MRTVMGSPTATLVGPAVTAMVYWPIAPLKFGGTFSAGNGRRFDVDLVRSPA